jgi:hypothetical protein
LTNNSNNRGDAPRSISALRIGYLRVMDRLACSAVLSFETFPYIVHHQLPIFWTMKILASIQAIILVITGATCRALIATSIANRRECFSYSDASSFQISGRATILVFGSSSDDVDSEEENEDTVRVRIWRALASGEELSLKQLGLIVGERKDLKSHLVHVEKQAKTLKNKSNEWRERRGLSITDSKKNNKLSLIKRRDRREIYVRLG